MPQYPNIPQAIGLLIITLVVEIVLAVPVLVFAAMTHIPIMEHPLTIGLVNLIAIGLVLHWGLKRTQAPSRDVFRFTPIRLNLLLPLTLVILGMNILLSEADNLLRAVLPIPPEIAQIFERLINPEKDLWASILTLVVIAPLTEELLFRGLILRGFLENYSTPKALVVSAVMFGVFHLMPWQIFGAIVMGILFAWWFVKTRSLLPCLFGHALNNALPLILMAIPSFKIPGYSGELTGSAEFQPLWFDVLGLFMAGAGVWQLNREFRKASDNFTENVISPSH